MLKRMQILVPEETYETLRAISFNTKKSMSQLIVEALEVWDKSKGTPPTRPQVPTITTGPINKGGAIYNTSTGEVSLGNEFHPVPKGKKKK